MIRILQCRLALFSSQQLEIVVAGVKWQKPTKERIKWLLYLQAWYGNIGILRATAVLTVIGNECKNPYFKRCTR